MTPSFRARRAALAVALCATLAPLASLGQAAASPTVRLRGTIEALTPTPRCANAAASASNWRWRPAS